MTEIESLISRLKSLEQGCEDKCLDLKTLKFDVQEGEMRLFNPFQVYYFKIDPKNPKDPKIVHAVKQFCKAIRVPYSFFSKNPEYMKKNMTECWLPTLKPEKSSVLAKLRVCGDKEGSIIRAILPVEFTNITNSEVIEALAKEVGDQYKLDFIIGEERDDLILHVRFVSKDEFDICGEKYTAGFSVVASELGASPLKVETFLYRCSSKAAFLATYATESFFSFEYEKIQKSDLQNLFPSLMVHIGEKLGEIKCKIQAAKEIPLKKENVQELLMQLRLNKNLNEKFHVLMFQEMEKDGGIKTRWDFVNKMSIVAKDFDVDHRLKIERAAGSMLGLLFEKN